MFVVLGILGLALLQENVRVLEDPKVKQRLLEADQHYRLGVEAMQTERFEDAVLEFRQAVKLDPNSFLAYYSLGKTYISLKRYDDSVRAYLSCREAWDRSAAEGAQQGFDQETRREDQIRALQDRILELESQMRTAVSDAERRTIQGRIDNIKLGISSMEQLRGSNLGGAEPPAEFALALGSAYFRAGSHAEAEKAYREALRLRPKYGEAHNNLAVICLNRGDYEEAYTHVKAAQKAGFKVHPQLVKDIETARRDARK
ncbi:MAG TPA: tetratricopeptide repeat protein [Vicinamibacteria bacterium]|nr:tetratricopeptide repeat protein [Vicinamibacteria bacterium]